MNLLPLASSEHSALKASMVTLNNTSQSASDDLLKPTPIDAHTLHPGWYIPIAAKKIPKQITDTNANKRKECEGDCY